jgi:hypothetical protein
MGKYVKGKQFENNSITSNLFNLTTPNSGETLSGATKEYADAYGSGSIFTHNIANFDMSSTTTTEDGQLACDIPLLSAPKSLVRVIINGLEIQVGVGKECYFSGDNGVTARENGEETIGDYLYWNGSIAGYELSVSDDDEIDFVYLIDK